MFDFKKYHNALPEDGRDNLNTLIKDIIPSLFPYEIRVLLQYIVIRHFTAQVYASCDKEYIPSNEKYILALNILSIITPGTLSCDATIYAKCVDRHNRPLFHKDPHVHMYDTLIGCSLTGCVLLFVHLIDRKEYIYYDTYTQDDLTKCIPAISFDKDKEYDKAATKAVAEATNKRLIVLLSRWLELTLCSDQ